MLQYLAGQVVGYLQVLEAQVASVLQPEGAISVIVIIVSVGQSGPQGVGVFSSRGARYFGRYPAVFYHHALQDVACSAIVEGVWAVTTYKEVAFASTLEQHVQAPSAP